MKILIIVFSDVDKDARVQRQIKWAELLGEVSICSYNYTGKHHHIKILKKYPIVKKIIDSFILKFGFYDFYYYSLHEIKQCLKKLKHLHFDLIIANDIQTLPLALRINDKAKVVFDAHEYSPLEHDESKFWKFFFHDYYKYLCEKYIIKTDLMFTVSYNIALEYEKNFKKRPLVLLNAPQKIESYDLKPSIDDTIRLVHHGIAIPQRKIEFMIDVIHALNPKFSLDLYLVPTNFKYYSFLKKYILKMENIRIYEPIQTLKIVSTISKYDGGLFFLPSKSFNYIYTLPNKLFDFIQAHLAVIIGPSPEMKKIVEDYQCGYVTKDFILDNVIHELSLLNKDQINQYRYNTHLAADQLNADTSREIFLNAINSLFNEE